MTKFYVYILTSICLACSSSPVENDASSLDFSIDDPIVQSIFDAQDQRQVIPLTTFDEHANPVYRKLVAQAFASVQGTEGIQTLAKLLRDPYQEVREEAAFALGQSYSQDATALLIEYFDIESVPTIRSKILEAIGKTGDEKDLEYILGLNVRENDQLQKGLALALYRFSLRDMISKATIARSLEILDGDNLTQTRWVAANYLARLNAVDLMRHVKRISDLLRNDHDPVVRMNMATALNKTNSNLAFEALQNAVLNDADYRVRVNAVNALAYFNYDQSSSVVFEALSDKHLAVQVVASHYFIGLSQFRDRNRYARVALTSDNWRVSANMLKATLKNADDELRNQINGHLKSIERKETNPYARAAYLEALSGDIKNYKYLAATAFSVSHAAVTTAAMQGIYNIRKDESFSLNLKKSFASDSNEVKREFIQIFKKGISSGETTLTALAAIALRNKDLGYRSKITDLDFLYDAQNNLILPREIETHIELQKTLDYFNDVENEDTENVFNHPIDWAYVESIKAVHSVRVTTTKGNFDIKLYIKKAPGTVSNFLKLAEGGFYDSLSFHRVVPNFVVQGGCPRGDGYGSTEYTIRSEFANIDYEEGSLGIASAGKDTESCQWFITHFPTAHLDGKYTNFGKIVSGMDVAHQLEMGDLILNISRIED